jgi:hypothetical protein
MQYFSLRTNQHQQPVTSQTNRLVVCDEGDTAGLQLPAALTRARVLAEINTTTSQPTGQLQLATFSRISA